MLSKRLTVLINNLNSITFAELLPRIVLVFIGSTLLTEIKKYFIQDFQNDFKIIEIIYYVILISYCYWIVNRIIRKFESSIYSSPSYILSSISTFCFSFKNQKEVFEPIVADWQEEYFEALFKKEIWKARWINVRYTYAFIAAMWQKSPLGDLIEFVVKIAKQ